MRALQLALLLVTLSAGAAGAAVRVAVPPFAGPADAADAGRSAVVAAIRDRAELVGLDEITQAAALSGADPKDPRSASDLAHLTRAAAFIVGHVVETERGYALTLMARNLGSDEPASAAVVSLAARSPSPRELAEIRRFAASAIADSDDLEADDDAGDNLGGDGEIRATPATRRAGGSVQIRAAIGLAATARRLSFSGADAPAPGLSSTPSPGLRVAAGAATRSNPSLAIDAAYEHALGARVQLPDGVQLPVAQSQWDVEASAALAWRSIELAAALGYGSVAHAIAARPANLAVPDVRYGFVSAGGDLRVRLGRASVVAGGRYLAPLSVTGIAGDATFGGAQTAGLLARTGFELATSARVAVRLSVRYARFALAFDGTGQMTGDGAVSGAVDSFTGGDAAVVFSL